MNVITKILKEMQRRCQGLWDVNKMVEYFSPSNQQQPARAFTGEQESAGLQGTDSTDFLHHVLNYKERQTDFSNLDDVFSAVMSQQLFLSYLRVSHADQIRVKKNT